ncbi:hypothetical protein Ancab_011479 [Ancistrocladus abbreviatus]
MGNRQLDDVGALEIPKEDAVIAPRVLWKARRWSHVVSILLICVNRCQRTGNSINISFNEKANEQVQPSGWDPSASRGSEIGLRTMYRSQKV